MSLTVETLLRNPEPLAMGAPGYKLRRSEESATLTLGHLLDAMPDLLDLLDDNLTEEPGAITRPEAVRIASESVGQWLRELVAEVTR